MEGILVIEMLVLIAAVVVPTAAALRGRAPFRGEREPALLLHRAQLRELERDRGLGLIGVAEHAAAAIEVQRRLLRAADGAAEPGPVAAEAGSKRGRAVAAAGLAAMVLAAAGLYGLGGHPGFGPLPAALRADDGDAARDAALARSLRDSLAAMPPDAPDARQGWLLLGQVEATRGDWAAAASAWDEALKRGFDPAVAMEEAEALTRTEGGVGDRAAALFRRALAAAPADATWRPLAEQRLAQHSHAEQPGR